MASTREETHAKAKALIDGAGTRIICVEFFKKDGTLRKMQVHPTAIINRLVGDDASDSAKRGVETRKANHPELYPVVDLEACRAGEDPAIRSINLDRLVAITVNGTRYEFDPVDLT